MGAALIGVIHGVLDPGLDLVAKPTNHSLNRRGHRPEVDRDVLGLGEHFAGGVERRGRAIGPLFDVGRRSRPPQHEAHLVGYGR